MIIINGNGIQFGNNIGGSNNIIVNGRIMGGNTANSTKIDDSKMTSKNAKRIVINGNISTVSITADATSNITAHLHGECSFDGSAPILSVTENSEEIRIDVKWSGNYFSGQLCLDIVVPNILYNTINTTTESGSVSVNNSVKTKIFKAKSKSGSIRVDTVTCESFNISTMSGSINVGLTTNTDVSLNLQSMSGNIALGISNVAVLSLESSTMSGRIKNRFKSSTNGYIAHVYASTMSGNISIN